MTPETNASECPRCERALVPGAQHCEHCGWDRLAEAEARRRVRLTGWVIITLGAAAAALLFILLVQKYLDRSAAMEAALAASHSCGSYVPDDTVRTAVEEFHSDGFSWAKAAKTESDILCPLRAP